jgi:hypothetical protein
MKCIKFIKKFKWEIAIFISLLIFLICYLINRDNSQDENEETFQINHDAFYLLNPLPPSSSSSPKKSKNKYENICREIVEKIYNKPFPSVRPDFLKNPKTGKNLELDMYNSELNLALEYNGSQHYHYNPYYHPSYDHYLSQVERDDFKRQVCKSKGITLIEIPYTVRKEDFEDYIRNELQRTKKLN